MLINNSNIKKFILEQSLKQSFCRKLRNKFLGFKYQIEDFF